MPRRNRNALEIRRRHTRTGSGWMSVNKGKGSKKKREKRTDAAPLTPGVMHSKTRLR
jgi:hypothetical protein